jgi:hypothetical protein
MHQPGRITLSCRRVMLLSRDIRSFCRASVIRRGKERTFCGVNIFFTENLSRTTFMPSDDATSAS